MVQRILVLAVDKDNDVGRKAGAKTPLIGREAVLATAAKLALADPADADSNALYAAVKTHDELAKKGPVEVAVLAGSGHFSVESDQRVAAQLTAVLKRFRATGAVLVSDGKGDESVAPLIQAQVPLISVQRVVIKQAEHLESSFYTLRDFLKESLEDSKVARTVFGIPAIALILLGLYGLDGLRFVIGLLGAYLLIKALKVEDWLFDAAHEARAALHYKHSAFFLYVVSLLLVLLGVYRGLPAAFEWWGAGLFEAISGFLRSAVYFWFLAGSAAWIGVNLRKKTRSLVHICAHIVLAAAVSLLVHMAAEFVLIGGTLTIPTLLTIASGFVLMGLAGVMEWKG